MAKRRGAYLARHDLSINDRKAVTIDEFARVIGSSRASIYRWLLKENAIQTLKIGRRRFIPVTAIDAFLKENAG
jgi:excisionase family DNA binding protein